MRVLLTGAAGFLGAHVLRRWLDVTGWDFVCPVTFRHKGDPQRLVWAMQDTLLPDRVTVVRHDCATPVTPTTAYLFGDVDLIVNLAADTHPPRSIHHPVEFYENNVGIALHLLEYARTLPSLTAFVQVSTDSVYGPAASGTHREWDPHNPNNPYSASKAAQEDASCAWWRSFAVPVLIAATMNPTGETQNPEKFVPMAIGKLLAGETITVHTNRDGTPGARTYLYARDFADGLAHLLKHQPPHRFRPGIDRPARWNIVGQREVDNRLVVLALAEALGVRYNVVHSPVDRPEHGHRYAMAGDKLADAGWTAPTDIMDALAAMATWTAKNPVWLRP